ncbi:MAG: protein kinase, partial [Planctomycetota bacterium]|nr:protein kinase [Planctomycetota bacterium]
MSSPSESDPSSNLPLLGEHYQLTAKLGEGAFGEVYKANHDLLGQEFAVKLLKPELSADQDVQDRFLDEARALIRFSHPNVVQMRHVGRHQGRLFLVMDYAHGVELAELMQKDGAFDEKRALSLTTQILAGLEAAHAAGIVHRDLKPSNILVETLPDGSEKPMILDFGLSKFSAIDGPGGAHRSITGTIVGTLAYMSPEQIKGDRDIDGRSDLFAAGLILQEMLQGHHPYPGESGIVVAAKLLRDPIPPIDEDKRDKISDHTLSALARALERDRDARFSSVTAFSQSLAGKGPPSDTSKVTTVQEAQAELARQEALEAARQAKAKAAAPSQPDTVKTRASAAAAGGAGGKKSPLLPILAVAGLAIAAGAYFLFGQDGDDDPKDNGGGTRTTNAGAPPAKGTVGQGEPVKATPTKAEPAKAQPTKAEPTKAEPTKAEPTKAEPTKAEPTKAEPTKAEPTKAEPTK